jgi:hypothetical protein
MTLAQRGRRREQYKNEIKQIGIKIKNTWLK